MGRCGPLTQFHNWSIRSNTSVVFSCTCYGRWLVMLAILYGGLTIVFAFAFSSVWRKPYTDFWRYILFVRVSTRSSNYGGFLLSPCPVVRLFLFFLLARFLFRLLRRLRHFPFFLSVRCQRLKYGNRETLKLIVFNVHCSTLICLFCWRSLLVSMKARSSFAGILNTSWQALEAELLLRLNSSPNFTIFLVFFLLCSVVFSWLFVQRFILISFDNVNKYL